MQRIIVVDDDQEIREIVTFALEREGFAVETAGSGQQLQQLLSTTIPDLILLDVMMPGEDGYRIFNTLRAAPLTRHIPVIIMTAHAEEIYERISADLGVTGHITKPFHPFDLVERIHAFLRTDTKN